MTDNQLRNFAETQVVLAMVEMLKSEIDESLLERASALDTHNEAERERLSSLPNASELDELIISYGEAFVAELLKRQEDAINDDN